MSDPTQALFVPPTPDPISLELARALAEAAEGLAVNDEPFYLVARYKPIVAVFAGGFVVRGPFASYADVPQDLKDEIDEHVSGFFGRFQVTPPPVIGAAVDQVDLHIRGWPGLFTYPTMPDALFFSPSAVEKFALPYYERIFGPEFAARVRDEFAAADVQAMAHYPWSEYSDGTRVPGIPVFLRLHGTDGALRALTPTPVGAAVLRPVVAVG